SRLLEEANRVPTGPQRECFCVAGAAGAALCRTRTPPGAPARFALPPVGTYLLPRRPPSRGTPMSRLVLLALLAAPCARAADKPIVLDLWPGKPPGIVAAQGEERDLTKPKENLVAGKRVIRLGHVSKPTLTAYLPAKPNGTCVIVCPGGGYSILALDLEGTEVCQWLNRIGVTAVLLKYRVPAPSKGARHLPALMDAQPAMSLVRSKASEWKIDPKKIGILGFSAGGHLAAVTATGEDKRAYDSIDKADELNCRPNFAVLIYPGYLTDRTGEKLSSDLVVTKDTPP